MDAKLRRLRSDVNLSGIFVRDYLLDVAREHAPEYRQRLAEFRRPTWRRVAELRVLGRAARRIAFVSLQAQARRLLADVRSAVRLDAAEKIFRSASFLRREVVPRREAVLAIAQEIEELNNANLAAQRAEVARRQAAFRDDLRRLLWQTVLLGLAVALIVVFRLRVLERRSDEQRSIAEEAERQMRQLSQRLVATQEEERKNLSRELHDHVGAGADGLADGAWADRADEAAGRRAARRGGGRMPSTGRQHVPHRSGSRARPSAEHAR